jgi:hypothetical protein
MQEIEDKRMKNLVASSLVGAIGGLMAVLLASRFGLFWQSAPVYAEPSSVLRATRFELIDQSGHARGVIECRAGKDPALRLTSQDGATLLELGLIDSSGPYLKFFGSDRQQRLAITMNMLGKPVLAMGDEDSPSKVVFGAFQPDTPDPAIDVWGLQFRRQMPTRTIAGIFMRRAAGEPSSGSIMIVGKGGLQWSQP